MTKIFQSYIRYIILTGLFINLLVGCDKCSFKKTNTGLEYKIVQKGEGIKPKNEQLLLIDMLYETPDKKVIFDSKEETTPFIVPYHDTIFHADGGIYEAISLLGKGDKFIFKIPAKSLLGESFKNFASEHNLKENTLIYTHIHVKDIKDAQQYKKQLAEEYKAKLKKQKQQQAIQLPKDLEILDKYLSKKNIKALSTNSGLRYVIHKPGKGIHPKSGNIVMVNYVGKTLDGQVFDTSIAEVAKKNNIYDPQRAYVPIKFTIGEGGMMSGFEEGVKLLRKNGKADLFIPSVLAYGPNKLGKYILPNSNLIFEIELVDMKIRNID